MTNPIYNAQHLLYRWMSHYEKKSYQSIKEACDHLNSSMKLGIYGNPMWALFYPLMRVGIVECVGNDYYAVTNTVVLDCDTHLYVVNGGNEYDYPYVGYKMIDRKNAILSHCIVVKLSTLAILKSFPTIRDVIYNWDNSFSNNFPRFEKKSESHFFRYDPIRQLNCHMYHINVFLELQG